MQCQGVTAQRLPLGQSLRFHYPQLTHKLQKDAAESVGSSSDQPQVALRCIEPVPEDPLADGQERWGGAISPRGREEVRWSEGRTSIRRRYAVELQSEYVLRYIVYTIVDPIDVLRRYRQ